MPECPASQVNSRRVRDWELVLARVCAFGFVLSDDGGGSVQVERDGRVSEIDLVNVIRLGGRDPRDIWLLKMAVEDGHQWEACETYFVLRSDDGATMPVELRLGRFSDEARTLFLDHDMLDGRNERTALRDAEDLHDLLPPLGAPNSIGYHRARERILTSFERLRPRSWAEVGVDDAAVIAEYSRYGVTADDVTHARENGREAMDEIIADYGIPPNDGWFSVNRTEINDD